MSLLLHSLCWGSYKDPPSLKGRENRFHLWSGEWQVSGKAYGTGNIVKAIFGKYHLPQRSVPFLSTRLEAIRHPSTHFLSVSSFYWGLIPHSSPFHPLSKWGFLCTCRAHFPVHPLDPPLLTPACPSYSPVIKLAGICRCRLVLFTSLCGNWSLGNWWKHCCRSGYYHCCKKLSFVSDPGVCVFYRNP